MSFNIMAEVTVKSFWSPRKLFPFFSLFPFFPYLFTMKWWDQMPHKQLDTSEATGHTSTYYEINKVGDGELGRASALEEVQIEDT